MPDMELESITTLELIWESQMKLKLTGWEVFKIICLTLSEAEIQMVSFQSVLYTSNDSCYWDWTGNPNPQVEDELIWENFVGTGTWNLMGKLTFEKYSSENDQRFERCKMLDEIRHYMLHWFETNAQLKF